MGGSVVGRVSLGLLAAAAAAALCMCVFHVSSFSCVDMVRSFFFLCIAMPFDPPTHPPTYLS